MFLDLVRDPSKTFLVVEDPTAVTRLRLWHCKYKTLAALANFTNLEELAILTLPDPSLDMLSGMSRLRHLRLMHLPKVTSLEPLASLMSLECLSLETLPSWDSGNKRLEVDSLEPLARLPKLQHLELLGVRPKARSLTPLLGCKQLKTARISKFPKAELERFYAESKVSDGFKPLASFEV